MNLKLLLASALTLVSGAAFAQSAPRVTPQGVVVNPVETALRVNVRLDKGGNNPLYIEGEKQRISVTVNQDAYVYIFNLQANGAVTVLLPNGFSGGTPLLRANETRTFPPSNAGYELTIAAPFGQEKILALASKRQLDLGQVIPQVRSGSFVTATVQGQEGLARALAVTVTPLPPQDWVTDVADFQTRSRSAPPAANGTLQVTSNVGGANVYVDGVLVGRTPLTLNIPAGQRNIRVSANGYRDESATVNVAGGQTTRVNLTLDPIQQNGTLAINVSPNINANVYVDGVLVGRGDTRINIPAGQRTIRVSANGYEDFQQTVNVVGGQTTTVNANLRQIQQNGVLVVNVNSNNANVYVDGVLVGRGDTRINIPSGQRTVRVTLDGFEDFQQVVTVFNGQTTTVNVSLQPIVREGTLVVRSNIAGARVFINGNEVGAIGQDGSLTVNNLPAGSHELVVIAPGYRAFVSNFSINAGQVTQITASLNRL
jgi:Domain of unknown function (DUF4384)/PEGA domain